MSGGPVESRGAFAGERMAGATAWRVTFLAVQGGGSVLLFALLAHAVPRPAIAALAVAQAVLVIAQALGDFGLSQAAVTVLPARIAAAPERAPELLASAAQVYFAAALAALGLTLLAALAVPHGATVAVLVSAPAAAATVLVSGADGLLRSRGEFRLPVFLMAASELGGFAGVPVAFATGSVVWTAAAVSAGTTIGAAGALVTLVRLRRAGRPRAAREFGRAAVPLGLSQVFIVLGTRIDTLLVGAISGLLAAGAFEGAWRVYQLGQYAVGAVATAAAPFVADALGADRHEDALALLRRLFVRLFLVGVAVGLVLYFGRVPIAQVLTGALAPSVVRVLPVLALLSPVAAVGLLGFYTLIARDGERRFVLAAHAVGAVINIALAAALAGPFGARGAMIGCAVGLVVLNAMLLVRLGALARALGRAAQTDVASSPAGVALRARR